MLINLASVVLVKKLLELLENFYFQSRRETQENSISTPHFGFHLLNNVGIRD